MYPSVMYVNMFNVDMHQTTAYIDMASIIDSKEPTRHYPQKVTEVFEHRFESKVIGYVP